jgi:hypothetical protein
MITQSILDPLTAGRRFRHWALLIAIAFAGSAFYGASLAYALGETGLSGGAAWLVVAAGLSWCIFAPMLIAVTGRKPLACAYECLVTMAYGEAVLAAGTVVNFASHALAAFPAASFNWAWIALSNVVMAWVLMTRFRSAGVPWWKTLAAWIVGLDGAGAVLFWIFRGLLQGGH